jgi:hypothetical protein
MVTGPAYRCEKDAMRPRRRAGVSGRERELDLLLVRVREGGTGGPRCHVGGPRSWWRSRASTALRCRR